jgi:hypothetical protein
MNELKKELVRSTFYNDETHPDELFADLYSFRQRLEDNYSLTQYGDSVVLYQIIYNTKTVSYQMQVAIIKDQISTEDIQFKADATYVREVTLDYVQAKYRHIFATLKLNPGKTSKGPVMLLATGTPTKKMFTKPF